MSEKSLVLLGDDEREDVEALRSLKVIASEEEDNGFLDELENGYRISAFNQSTVGLTILPTVDCNLRCPYCFETSKPRDYMSAEIQDALIEFVKGHVSAKFYSICWFGGEPLLGIDIMESLLDKFKNVEELELKGHSIVTNGTLLDDRAVSVFERHPLDSMQITFDGLEESHDRKRRYPDGKGSFDLILSNLDKFVDRCPKTHVSIRVNVDNSNSDQYEPLRHMLGERYKGKNLSVYPAPLRANPGCGSRTFFTVDDLVNFTRKTSSSDGKFHYYPSINCSKGCTATQISSYVIGPLGEIYPCWENVGKPEWVIGNIKSRALTNDALFHKFVAHGHCFDNAECRECGLLPICSGGCPQRRVEAFGNDNPKELCTILKHGDNRVLEDFLYETYKSMESR